MKPEEVLENSLIRAIQLIDAKKENEFPKIICSNVDVLINKIDKNKSLVSALVTSLEKKLLNPNKIFVCTEQILKVATLQGV